MPSVATGSPGVGMTLLDALGVPYTSIGKPTFEGIVVSARRTEGRVSGNRVNLFARVPAWEISSCKSSGEILSRFGYMGAEGEQRLYCTVRAGEPNSQGLFLEVSRVDGLLLERARLEAGPVAVVAWKLSDLRDRLAATHRESMWVTASAIERRGREYFHYRRATYSPAPLLDRLAPLLQNGTITVDHLIERRSGRVSEKGPLFKIKPQNLEALFPIAITFDLLA